MHFENCGCLYEPFLVLLVSLIIYVELVHKLLGITFILCGHKTIFEVLIEGQLLVSVYLTWCISASYTS